MDIHFQQCVCSDIQPETKLTELSELVENIARRVSEVMRGSYTYLLLYIVNRHILHTFANDASAYVYEFNCFFFYPVLRKTYMPARC